MVFSLIWCLKRSSSRQSTCIDLVLLAKWFWKCCFRGKTKTFSAAETHLQKYYKTIRKFCFSHEIIQNDSVLQLKLFRMNSWVFISRQISVVLSWLEIFFFQFAWEEKEGKSLISPLLRWKQTESISFQLSFWKKKSQKLF